MDETDDLNIPKCSRDPDVVVEEPKQQKSVYITVNSDEETDSVAEPKSFSILTKSSSYYARTAAYRQANQPLTIKSSEVKPITNQPRMSSMPSPMSVTSPNQPQTLFLLALSKLNDNSLNLSLLKYLQSNLKNIAWTPGDVTPPDSLTNAPPSYSFVLRQMAARRRPRLLGTFIPSRSFVQHTPPPTYAAAFDIYIDPVPPPPPRIYSYGFTPIPVVCPECGYAGMTVTTCKITICTHVCALILCLFCCWICSPLPYILRSCKDVYHYCRNCRYLLGMYCPTTPEAPTPYPMTR